MRATLEEMMTDFAIPVSSVTEALQANRLSREFIVKLARVINAQGQEITALKRRIASLESR